MKRLVFDPPEMTPPGTRGGAWALAYDWTVVFRDECYHVPAGFRTDGASIPRALWWLCGTPLEAPRLYAAIIHDYIYGGGDPDATRADADDLYRDLQIALGVSRVRAYVEWLALRLFGWRHWRRAAVAAALAAALAAAVAGCIDTANVESFVTLPGRRVPTGEKTER